MTGLTTISTYIAAGYTLTASKYDAL